MAKLLTDAIRWWERSLPERAAVVCEGEQVTYRELGSWTDGVARWLLTEGGLAPGDVVAIAGYNLGAVKAGAVVAPFNYRYTASELGHLVEDATPLLVFADEQQAEKLRPASAGSAPFTLVPLSQVRQYRTDEAGPQPIEPSPDDAVVLAYTSGTTGQPKGLVYTHETVLSALFELMLKDPTPPEETTMLLAVPLFSVAGIVHAVLHMAARGATLVVMSDFDPSVALDLLTEHRVSHLNGVPVIWERISREPSFEQLDLSHIKVAMVGGARVSNELQQRWHQQGVVLRHMYGMTEVGGCGSVPRPPDALSRPDLCGDGSVFTETRIVRPDGTECQPGEEGEILMRGPGMLKEYWRNPEGTAALMPDGWIHSGDIGVFDERGYLRYVDRLKDLIISGGFNVSPTEVENVIARAPGVIEVAVIPVIDDQWGETPAAIIHGSDELDVDQVLELARQELAVFKVPRYVVRHDGPLPRMPSQKIAKRDLREQYRDIASTAVRH